MPGNELIQSLVRGFRVLEVIADSGKGIRLNDIARSVSLKTTTVHNLLRTLVAQGYVKKVNGEGYVTGPMIIKLAQKVKESSRTIKLEKVLSDMFAKYPDLTFTFSEPFAGEIYNRLRIAPDSKKFVARYENRTMDLYTSASGLCALAFADEYAKEELYDNYPFYEYGASFWKSEEKFYKFLSEAKKRKIATSPFKAPTNYPSAIPVFDEENNFAGTLGVNFRGYDKIKMKQILPEVIKEMRRMLKTIN